ncbi:MAG: hypothetical protein JXB07_09790 [Anaerolineae bacterium]|nr:hypothetical protein [Anaerolineae bacterium]
MPLASALMRRGVSAGAPTSSGNANLCVNLGGLKEKHRKITGVMIGRIPQGSDIVWLSLFDTIPAGRRERQSVGGIGRA